MPELNDTQTILLSVASRREDFALYPLEGVTPGVRTSKAIADLISAGYAEQRDQDTACATIVGLTAIGVDLSNATNPASNEGQPAIAARLSKSATVVALLKRADGATMPDLIAATGWLPHTTRAALTGLRKKGHAIDRFKRDGQTCYRIAA